MIKYFIATLNNLRICPQNIKFDIHARQYLCFADHTGYMFMCTYQELYSTSDGQQFMNQLMLSVLLVVPAAGYICTLYNCSLHIIDSYIYILIRNR